MVRGRLSLGNDFGKKDTVDSFEDEEKVLSLVYSEETHGTDKCEA